MRISEVETMQDLALIHIQLHEAGIANGFTAKENVQACIQLAIAERLDGILREMMANNEDFCDLCQDMHDNGH